MDGAGNPVAGATVVGSPVLSGNGRFVAFTTTANLDANPADPSNTADLFVRDVTAGVTERWTLGRDPITLSISSDGRYVALLTLIGSRRPTRTTARTSTSSIGRSPPGTCACSSTRR